MPQNQRANQQPSPQDIPDVNPTLAKSKIPMAMIIIGIFLILVLIIGAFWIERETINKPITVSPHQTPTVNPTKTIENPILEDYMFTCENDTDCVKIIPKCKTCPYSVNKKYKQYAESMGCGTHVLWACPAIGEARCINLKCILITPTQYPITNKLKNCLVNGEKFLDGSRVPGDKIDMCNSCICSNGELVNCTLQYCPAEKRTHYTVIPVN